MGVYAVWAWVQAHPVLVGLLLLGAVANLSPRPHPDKLTGWQKGFWLVIDRLCFLAAESVPGRFKMFFTPSQLPPAAPPTSNTGTAPPAPKGPDA